MKIGIIAHLKFPMAKPFAGGLEAFTHGFVDALVARGHDVTLFAAGDSDPRLPLEPILPHATIPESLRRLGRVHDGWIDATEDEAYASLMTRLAAADFDLIHNHSLNPIPLRFASTLPTQMITTLHAPVLPRFDAELTSRPWQQCGRFVNISHANAMAWGRLVGDQTVIYNGIDTDFWKGRTTAEQPRAVWFGRIVPEKGTHLAIAAARRAGLPIDVVGPVSDQAYFDEFVAPSLGADCSYLGHKTHEQLSEIISNAAVAIITPCWDEPFGLVVAEALACGTPVAAFARGALPEIIAPSVGRLAYPGDIDDLALAIGEAIELNGEVCRRVAQERYSMERMMNDYEALYRRVQLGVAV